jgi:membrane protein YdbS with pleckstrin-like domain
MNIFRQSYIVLLSKLVIGEILMISLYLFVNIPKSILISIPQISEIISNYFWISVTYFFVLSILEIIMVSLIVLQWANEEYEIKDGMVYHRRGVFSRSEDVYTLKNLGSVNLMQNFWARLFNFGSVKLYSPILKQEFYIINVHNPKYVVSLIKQEEDRDNSQIIPRRRS